MKISSRCYALTGFGYSAPWCVNAGFIAGDEITLVVDTGGNALAASTIHGYASAVAPRNAIRVLNTEKHFDHICGNGYFRERGAAIWGHENLQRTAEEFAAEKEEFNQGIGNPVRRSHREADAFFTGTALAMPDHSIDRDISFDLGACTAEILLTPGHTETNLSVWVGNDRVLFTGDCLIRDYIPNLDGGSTADWKIWLESLTRIEALNAQLVVAGHGRIARGPEVQETIDRVRKVLHEAIAAGRSPTSAQAE